MKTPRDQKQQDYHESKSSTYVVIHHPLIATMINKVFSEIRVDIPELQRLSLQ